jgi:[FeFe] hydrogenase (group B1/B3)
MRKFESNVQLLKYKVLKEVCREAINDNSEEGYKKIPQIIITEESPRIRCCIYKERAIVEDRVKIARGGDRKNTNIIEVLSAACDECPINRFTVTEACRGCIAHKCVEACPVNAITTVGQRAYINPKLCIECGKCKSVCPYDAISDVKRPCVKACQVKAISIGDNKKALIDNEKCVQCGACSYQCPFGAIEDKSYICDIIELLKNSKSNKKYKVYAVIAPAIASQFTYAKIEQVVTGIKKLGFHDVVEAALGADIIAMQEASEFKELLEEKDFMTTSCCPAFVAHIKKTYPKLEDNISTSVSPMIAISKLIKHIESEAKVVFIGPCTAKKMEIQQEELIGYTDYVMTFEELQAMLDAAEIEVEKCEDGLLNNASFFGRIFAKSGGVTEAIKHIIEENNMDVEFKPVTCDGLKECDLALKMANVGRSKGNFIEGMACVGGCIGGSASLNHGPKDKSQIDKYGKSAYEKNVTNSLRIFNIEEINFKRK